MLLLRHHAHRMMRKEEHRRNLNYSSVLYVREDNRFYEAPPVQRALNVTQAKKAVVITDKHCDFGALNDKMFWASAHGAQVLFGNYTLLLSRWFYLGFVRSMLRCLELTQPSQLETQFGNMVSQQSIQDAILQKSAKESAPLLYDSMQSENFLKTVLNDTNTVHLHWDLKRIDVRYSNLSKCVPTVYHGCASNSYQGNVTIMHHGLPQCPGQECLHMNCDPRNPGLQAEFVRKCFKLADCRTGMKTLDHAKHLWMQHWLKQKSNKFGLSSDRTAMVTYPCTVLQAVLKHAPPAAQSKTSTTHHISN